ncbi:MAG: endonuclease domain-containing protein [Gammaproteobacteria bacterium]
MATEGKVLLGNSLVQQLELIQTGRARAFFADDVASHLASIELSKENYPSAFTLVTKLWTRVPAPDELIANVLDAMAEVALKLWPVWFGDLDFGRFENDSLGAAASRLALQQLAQRRVDVSFSWGEAALGLARCGKLPLPNEFPVATNVDQLTRVISANHLILLLGTEDSCSPEPRLYALARCAEWLAHNTTAAVALLIPPSLAESKGLDSILYGAVRLNTPVAAISNKAEAAIEDKVRIWPIHGRPHPLSPGEQLLAKYLVQDSDLGALFEFNRMIETARRSRYLVDLIWNDGRVVIEVDGYRTHGNQYAFSTDRHRDYELLVSGYLVLRLPHDEVIADPELAVDKIRDVVRFRRQNNKRGV